MSCVCSMTAGQSWPCRQRYWRISWARMILVPCSSGMLSSFCCSFSLFLSSAALSVKMSIILYLPGLLVIFFKRRGLVYTIRKLSFIFATQVLFAFPFIRNNWRGYIQGAFDLSRVFLYKWTVNWRMVSEETFLSPQWRRALLLGHVCTLIAFGWNRWCKQDGGVLQVLLRGLRRPTLPASLIPVTAECELRNCLHSIEAKIDLAIATILFTSNLIGILFARSLHYQFYCWYAQQLPFLTWKTRYPLAVKCIFFQISWYRS